MAAIAMFMNAMAATVLVATVLTTALGLVLFLALAFAFVSTSAAPSGDSMSDVGFPRFGGWMN